MSFRVEFACAPRVWVGSLRLHIHRERNPLPFKGGVLSTVYVSSVIYAFLENQKKKQYFHYYEWICLFSSSPSGTCAISVISVSCAPPVGLPAGGPAVSCLFSACARVVVSFYEKGPNYFSLTHHPKKTFCHVTWIFSFYYMTSVVFRFFHSSSSATQPCIYISHLTTFTPVSGCVSRNVSCWRKEIRTGPTTPASLSCILKGFVIKLGVYLNKPPAELGSLCPSTLQ